MSLELTQKRKQSQARFTVLRLLFYDLLGISQAGRYVEWESQRLERRDLRLFVFATITIDDGRIRRKYKNEPKGKYKRE